MALRKSPKQLSKFIAYVLGRSPGEFGLVLDDNGYIKIKDLLKAIAEEQGFRYVRRSHLDEIIISLPNPPIEINNNFIRAAVRDHLLDHDRSQNPPKLLYTCVREKAYPAVSEKGIHPSGFDNVVLSSTPDMAERMGKRKDPSPVMLIVQTQKAMSRGTVFYQAGDTLFLAESIPADCFTGPPIPKQKISKIKPAAPDEQTLPKYPGSFLVQEHNLNAHKNAYQQKTKNKTASWKKETKRKKQKPSREPPPWRR